MNRVNDNNDKIIFLHRIRKDICAIYGTKIRNILVVGSYCINNDVEDLDIAIIVNDDVDFYSFVNDISPIMAKYTTDNNVLINFFPIRHIDFVETPSQFIRNIHKHGHQY